MEVLPQTLSQVEHVTLIVDRPFSNTYLDHPVSVALPNPKIAMKTLKSKTYKPSEVQ